MAEEISSAARAMPKVRNALAAVKAMDVDGTVRTDGIKQPPPGPRPGMPPPQIPPLLPVRAQQSHPNGLCQICSFCDYCDPQPEKRGRSSVRVCRCQKLMNYMPPGSPGHTCLASQKTNTTSYGSQHSAAPVTWSPSGQYYSNQYTVPEGSPAPFSPPQSAYPTHYQTLRYAEEYSTEPDTLQTSYNPQNIRPSSSRCYRCNRPLSSCVNQHLPVVFHLY